MDVVEGPEWLRQGVGGEAKWERKKLQDCGIVGIN
jgi:hypothetical protein